MPFFPESRALWQTTFVTACDSTNTEVLPSLKEAKTSYLALRTDYQKAGRGQRGTKWQASQGQNLLCSFGIKNLRLDSEDLFKVTMVTSLMITEELQNLTGLTFSIKWPNDIYIETRKIAGILVESQFQGQYIRQIVIGVGLNLNQVHFDATNATSLLLETGQHFPPEALFERLLQTFVTNNVGSEGYMNRYLKQLIGFEKIRQYRDLKSGEIFEGRITGVNKWGNLLLLTDSGETRCYGHKEIEFLF